MKTAHELLDSGQSLEDRIAEAAAARAEAREAWTRAEELERRMHALRGEVDRAWQVAHALQDQAGRLQKAARPCAVLQDEEARLLAELKELEHEGGAS